MLRNKPARAYLAAGGVWTADVRLAQGFRDLQSLLSVASKFPQADVQHVLLYFEDRTSEYDITIDLGPRVPPRRAPENG